MKVLFVSSGNSKFGISPFIKSQGESLKIAGIDIDYFPIGQRGASGYIRACFHLRKYLSQQKYNIIHAHFGLSALVAQFSRRKEKLVVSFMGDDILGTNKPDGSLKKTSLWLARFNAFLADKYFDHSIVKSNEMQQRIIKASTSVIPNGVDLVQFMPFAKSMARTKLGIPHEKKIVIFVSDPDRVEKNFPLAEKSIKLLNIPDIKIVTLNGQPKERLLDYYNAADTLILTSFHEGSPNVIKEAMACNCPIVSTDVGDVKWIFGKTEGCFLTSFKPEDVAEKLAQAIEFSEQKGRTKGRERIIELGLDTETTAKKIIEVYKRVLL